MTDPKFDQKEEAEISNRQKLRADQVFEVVRREGDEELQRPAQSLAFSGLAAGLAIGFSVIAEAVIRARLPDAIWSPLIADLGYTVGFLIVILAKLQLFTENTITPVLPICYRPTVGNVLALLRIWSIVFAANMVGTVLFAAFALYSGAFSDDVVAGILALGRHAAHGAPLEIVAQGIGAGFLIAALVWVMADHRSATLPAILLFTWVIAICGFAHVVAGGVEMAALVFSGQLTLWQAIFGFMLPALIGNMIGGTGLFTLLAYGQIRQELKRQ
ncbi:formate/nitrite transporter family protein [Rhodobacteraceae bacterium NNCM2]|nr:formate/nitrite transporter family protein [Coraliihabitans acroporae]